MDAAYQNMNPNIFTGGVNFPQSTGNESDSTQPPTNISPETNTAGIGTTTTSTQNKVTKTDESTKKTEEAKVLPQPQVVDLLDDQTNSNTITENQIAKPADVDALGPTSSEVDDLD